MLLPIVMITKQIRSTTAFSSSSSSRWWCCNSLQLSSRRHHHHMIPVMMVQHHHHHHRHGKSGDNWFSQHHHHHHHPTTSIVMRSNSDSITYSGGQASVGQGGFYGSGGARSLSPDHTITSTTDQNNVSDQQNKERNKMLAMAHDVQTVRITMQEYFLLESLLHKEEEKKSDEGNVSSKSMEIKNSIKKLMTQPEFLDSLQNLEVRGEPAWGLSCAEREMCTLAREKVNEC